MTNSLINETIDETLFTEKEIDIKDTIKKENRRINGVLNLISMLNNLSFLAIRINTPSIATILSAMQSAAITSTASNLGIKGDKTNSEKYTLDNDFIILKYKKKPLNEGFNF